ncbi:hypothetical protein [Pantoea allii]|uniref:hypothetical protein n=1 Tax=Pantoea allii TaxID=574096 RepID=UPI0024B6D401|nr:hypothetical protein [Pantoea allii]MDJ0041737.1 hypothetical protein [Pantoea allii]
MSDFFDTFVTSAVALTAIGATCKIFLTHIDKRTIESFKLKIKSENDALLLIRNHELEKINATSIELGRWSNTLLSATNGLIGRLKFIRDNNPDINDQYLVNSTRYYFGQYLCWGLIYRKNRDANLLSPISDEILIGELMKNVSVIIRDNNQPHPLVRSLEQRYIGEKMLKENECIGYSEYLHSELTSELSVLNDYSDSILIKRNLQIIVDLIFHLEKLQCHFKEVLKRSHNT